MCLQAESTLEGHHVNDAIGQLDQVAFPGRTSNGATDDLLIFLLQGMHITAGTEPGGLGTATPGDVDVGPALLGGGGEVSILIGIGGAQDDHAGAEDDEGGALESAGEARRNDEPAAELPPLLPPPLPGCAGGTVRRCRRNR